MPKRIPALIRTKALAEILGESPRTTENRRLTGNGPRFIKLGASKRAPVAYLEDDVADWLEKRQRRTFTDERSAA